MKRKRCCNQTMNFLKITGIINQVLNVPKFRNKPDNEYTPL
jgi:hypothetical protein